MNLISPTHMMSVNPMVRTMRRKKFILLSLYGHLRLCHVFVHRLSRLKRISEKKLIFTFDVSKCDHIFDELLRSGNIKLSHVIPPLEELKRHAYCKWHSLFSHATNDCNVFRRHVQSAVNEERLTLLEL